MMAIFQRAGYFVIFRVVIEEAAPHLLVMFIDASPMPFSYIDAHARWSYGLHQDYYMIDTIAERLYCRDFITALRPVLLPRVMPLTLPN